MNQTPATSGSETTSTPGILYRVGSLSYTRGALFTMLFWMLWADLALQLMELLQTIVPIQLERLGTSSTATGFIRDTMQALITLMILPLIGAQSDRHRGPMGRRRPFLLFSILPLSACLIALGYAEPISQWVHGLLAPLPLVGGFAIKTVGVAMVVLFVGGFFLFNNYTLPVYQYLIADIVPKEIMGKFIGAYRAIGAISGFLFNKVLFPHVDTHIEWIYISCTLFYAFAFVLLVWRIREGELPPPDTAVKKPGPIAFMQRYAHLCFSNWFYWKVYLTSLCYWAAMVPFYNFGMLYFKTAPKGETMTALNLFPSELGDIRAWTFLPQLIVFPIVGILIDRFHSLRFLIIGFAGMASCFVFGLIMAYSQPHIVPTKSADAKTLVTLCTSKLDAAGKPERIEKVMTLKDIQKVGEGVLAQLPEGETKGVKITFKNKLVPNPAYTDACRTEGIFAKASRYLRCRFTGTPFDELIPSTTERIQVTTTEVQGKDPVRTETVVSVAELVKTGEAKLTEIAKEAPAGTTKSFADKYYNHAPIWAWVWYLTMMIVLAVIQLSYLAMQPALFPRETYGQFFSANQWIFSIGLVLAPLISGFVLDIFKDYRLIFVWSSVFFILAAIMSVSLFRHWKKLGGDKHYTPPGSTHEQVKAPATH
jgi:MFS family permease